MLKNAIFTFLCFTFLHIFIEGKALSGPVNKTTVRVLNWWNYLDERIVKALQAKGIELDISIYHSNEVALSRLLSKRESFEVAIVSNINLDLLIKEKIFDTKILKKLVNSREYLRHLVRQQSCVPYLWGTTIFAIDGRASNDQVPGTLDELKKLKSQGFQIGVLDDPFEMSARILGDNINKCPKKVFSNFFSNIASCGEAFSDSKLGFSSADFLTSSDEFLLKDKIAVYTWQGSVFTNIQKTPWLKFGLSQNNPVVGADYVCVVQNKGLNNNKKKIIYELVKTLTSKVNTKFNVESSQYFSPYKNDLEGLQPRVQKLYRELNQKILESEPIFLTTPNPKEHQEINVWWKKVRYETK